MICTQEGCKGVLKVTHTYSQHYSKFQRAVCELCRQVHCVTSFVQPVTREGEGAANKAQSVKRGVPLGDQEGLTKIRRPGMPKRRAGKGSPAAP